MPTLRSRESAVLAAVQRAPFTHCPSEPTIIQHSEPIVFITQEGLPRGHENMRISRRSDESFLSYEPNRVMNHTGL